MPPRPPLSSSSSFTLLPLSDARLSFEQAHPSSNRLTYSQTIEDNRYPKEPPASSYDEHHILQSESTTKRDEDSGSSKVYSGYGGAGYHTKPQRGRLNFRPLRTYSDTMETETKEAIQSLPFLPIDKDKNVSEKGNAAHFPPSHPLTKLS
jgi:hypothetical protein